MGVKKADENNLKIAMLGHKRVPSREGGIEVVVEELSSRMVALGHSVTCLNRDGKHVAGKEFGGECIGEYKGIKIRTVLTIDKRGLAAMSASFFGAIEAAFGKYDVVHFHAEGPCAMLWLPKLFGKRCVATIHGLDHQRAKWGKFAKAYIMLGEKCAVKFADEIIVLSADVKKYFKNRYGRETVLIPNGVNKPELREPKEITEKWGLTKDEYILYLGRIVPEKGIQYLIEAFKRIETNKKLVIAGGASDSQGFLNQLIEEGRNDSRIVFTGFVQGRILEELYSNAYVYCLPSDLEGMPLSLLEAMSYGNCCLVSDIPECVDVVENNAMCFRRASVKDLEEKLKKLIDVPKTVLKYKSGSSEYVCQQFNWDNVVEQTIGTYR